MHGLKKTQETGKNIEKKISVKYVYIYDHFKKLNLPKKPKLNVFVICWNNANV